SKIYQLQQKHGVSTVEELIQIESDLASKAFELDHLDEEMEKRKAEMERKWGELKETGTLLSKKRAAAFAPFTTNIQQLLTQLGMEEAVIRITGHPVDPLPSGMDEIEILFTANKGSKPQPIRHVAS